MIEVLKRALGTSIGKSRRLAAVALYPVIQIREDLLVARLAVRFQPEAVVLGLFVMGIGFRHAAYSFVPLADGVGLGPFGVRRLLLAHLELASSQHADHVTACFAFRPFSLTTVR